MSWTLAVVRERNGSNSTVIVPTKWVLEDYVFWADGLNATRDMESQVTNWPKYKLVKVKLTSGI